MEKNVTHETCGSPISILQFETIIGKLLHDFFHVISNKVTTQYGILVILLKTGRTKRFTVNCSFNGAAG